MGPVLFSLYTKPLHILYSSTIFTTISMPMTSSSVPYNPADPEDCSVNSMQKCVQDIKSWMISNYLQLNDEKTEVVNLMSPYHMRTYGNLTITFGDTTIQPSSSVKNLDVKFHQQLTLAAQETSVVSSTNYHLRNIGRVRKYLTTEACKNSCIAHRLLQCIVLWSLCATSSETADGSGQGCKDYFSISI